jgi:4-hydroxy-2-oxoheptanedioate aldolase
MRPSRIRERLAEDRPCLIHALHLQDPSLYEMTALNGFDGIWLDLEHHAVSVQRAGELMRAARVGWTDIVARPARGEFMRAARLLEAGAEAILYPRCESAEEAAELVRWTRFAPQGQRGYDGASPDMPYLTLDAGEYVRAANERTFLIVQIESPEALARVGEIAAVEGVDALMFGPADYSVLCGFPGRMDDPRIAEARERVLEAALAAGKHCGWPVASVEDAAEWIPRGLRLVFHGADLSILQQAQRQMLDAFAPLGFSFENRVP